MVFTVVIRHPKERVSKCSLQPLVGRRDLCFLKGKPQLQFVADGWIQLVPDGPVLTAQDGEMEEPERIHVEDTMRAAGYLPEGLGLTRRPLLLLDSTWRLLPSLERLVLGEPMRRSLPEGIETAYPRHSKTGREPENGLASVEALYVARRILGDADPSLLEAYLWRDRFMGQFRDGAAGVVPKDIHRAPGNTL